MKKGNKNKKLPAGFDPAKTDFENQEFQKGDFVFLEGALPAGMYFVKKGKIKLYKKDKEGSEKILRYAKVGDFIGYTDLINNEKYTRSAEADETSTLLFIPKKDFDDLMNSREITMYFFRLTSTELNMSEEVIVNGYADSAVEDNKKKSEPVLEFKLTELVNLLGDTTETFIKVLSELNNKNTMSIRSDVLTMPALNRQHIIKHLQNQLLNNYSN